MYVPKTTLAIGVARLGDALPAIQKPKADDIKIDDDVPMPSLKKKGQIVRDLLARMQPGQSAKLQLDMLDSLSKATMEAHKTGQKRFSTRTKIDDDQSLRVWRIK